MKTLKSAEGFAIFVAILVMAVIMLFLGISLFLSWIGTRITNNLKLGTQINLGVTGGTAGNPDHRFKIKKDAKIFDGLLMGPAAGEEGSKVEDDTRIYDSSQAFAMVNINWGSLLPRPPRVFAWQYKY